jgi:transcriptional regulator with XRE-family HTH domain
MKLEQAMTEASILEELGRRLAQIRVNANLTQAALGREAGVSRPTIERMEAGQAVRMDTFMRISKVLGLLEALDRAIPEQGPRPMDYLKRSGKKRKRAYPKKTDQGSSWKWGDEP